MKNRHQKNRYSNKKFISRRLRTEVRSTPRNDLRDWNQPTISRKDEWNSIITQIQDFCDEISSKAMKGGTKGLNPATNQ